MNRWYSHMRTQMNSETEEERWLEAGGDPPINEALFADALIASYRRAIEAVAVAALREAGGEVKPAILLARGVASVSEAVAWLAAAEGRIDDALRLSRAACR